MNKTRFFWGMAALALFLVALAVWRPMALPDEGRYGDVGRWMLVSGDWLTPRLDGMPFFHKPPLLHWLQASAMAVFGVHAWSARLVPALHACLMLACLYLAGRYIAGERTAQRAAWMLGTSLTFLVGGQYINHDMLVAAWVALAIWCFGGALIVQGPAGRRLAWLGFLACGLGVLSKGLIGLVLPGLVVFVWLFIVRLWPRALGLPWISGLLLFALVALPWFVLAQQQFSGMFDYLIVGQHFRRYTGTTFNNQWSGWLYLLVLAGMLFPWALIVMWDGVRTLLRQRTAVLRAPKPWTALLWVWLVVITVFFSLPKSKLVGYILPVIPPLALLAAQSWEARWGHSARANRVFALLCALNLVLAMTFNHVAGDKTLQRNSQEIAQALGCRIQPTDEVWVSGAYPYDLPFMLNLKKPVVVIEDWPTVRRTAGDNWQRELFEGADFDAAAARVLQTPDLLQRTPAPGTWLVTTSGMAQTTPLPQWQQVHAGRAWVLWRPAGSTHEGPESAQDKGLDCGHQHGHQQGRQ
jgi:4-amino-4-deoxy-L-arabinose transferase-like glycosyltransferase